MEDEANAVFGAMAKAGVMADGATVVGALSAAEVVDEVLGTSLVTVMVDGEMAVDKVVETSLVTAVVDGGTVATAEVDLAASSAMDVIALMDSDVAAVVADVVEESVLVDGNASI
jgi:predicted thioredoxin/glutaredoxin